MDGGHAISDFLTQTPPINTLHELEAFKGTEESSRDIKRQRFVSPSTPPTDRMRKNPEDETLEHFDLIKRLKLQIDKQKQILLRLAEENNEHFCLLIMEMETEATARIPSPVPSDSDSDSYNTESARIYFGPLKTPERKFAASSKALFPPPSTSPLRRSPRLSSPRPTSVTAGDFAEIREDLEDIEQVAQLVNESEDEEDSIPNSGVGTPQNGEALDEPSSALADRVIHALDNPSPPPSPPASLSLFDPYHTTIPEASTDYQADLMSLKITDTADDVEENPLLINYVCKPDPTPTLIPVSPPSSSLGSVNHTAQDVLIQLDSFSTPPMKKSSDVGQSHNNGPPVDSKVLSVDDLLLQSPAFNGSGEYPPQLSIPVVVVQPSEDEVQDVGSPMVIDDIPPPGERETVLLPLVSDPEEQQITVPVSPIEAEPNSNVAANPLLTTPLRRSTRPRRSVTPNPPSAPPTLVSPPSIARTQVKRRITNVEAADEVVSDSQDESDLRKSPSRVTPTPVRVRQRSPTKVAPSFQREVGSLSPTSSNVLSGLAFSVPDESTSGMVIDIPESQPSQPMFSFSVFAPPETTGPSTPVRNTGPIRFASPSKTSPQKFRIRTPAPNDPSNTPARRIPIAEAIVQGHMSPEKAVQLGYKPNGAPLPSVFTPARRVLLTDASAPSTSKLNNSRLGSPTRALSSKQREASSEPPQRLGQSAKGKERATETIQKQSTVVSKLPFPLVASDASSSETAPTTQEPTQLPKSSPVKSTLKQPTSRIPRIGAKPYSRSADNKSTAKPTPTPRLVDLAKPLPKPSIAENARRSVRVPDVTKTVAPPPSRVKPTATTSSMTMLKRKRETEKVSPAKPRVIILRQVPSVPVAPVDPPPPNVQSPVPAPSTIPATKKPSQGPLRIRKVMDPVPPAPRPATPPEIVPSLPESRLPTLKPSTTGQDVVAPKETSPPHLIELDDIVPGPSMKQEPPQPISAPVDQGESSTIIVVSTPTVTVTDFSTIVDPPAFGLRRTTRSRRNMSAITDVFSEGSSRSTATSRRKPSAFRSDDVFGGMSMTALKDLTTSNTVHNQKYLAARLETEVVRKQGIRPESPAVKVRTISQRQQEEKDKQRSERAQRRSRRSDEMASSDIEPSSDVGYSSPVEDQELQDGQELPKHQRGAGDEEDYVTPERHMRGLKRMRLFEDSEMQDVEPPKRVKWDRGLFTTVYIDEVQLGARQTLKENRTMKGILAPTAKALRLDTLGNLPYAEVPLTDLVPENITVKKIVYDSDVAAAEVVAVKNTRSKKKK